MTAELLSVENLPVQRCYCGRWTSACKTSCCVPCSNSRGRAEPYPHQWLCDQDEHQQRHRPRHLVPPDLICPGCAAAFVVRSVIAGRICERQCGWNSEGTP